MIETIQQNIKLQIKQVSDQATESSKLLKQFYNYTIERLQAEETYTSSLNKSIQTLYSLQKTVKEPLLDQKISCLLSYEKSQFTQIQDFQRQYAEQIIIPLREFLTKSTNEQKEIKDEITKGIKKIDTAYYKISLAKEKINNSEQLLQTTVMKEFIDYSKEYLTKYELTEQFYDNLLEEYFNQISGYIQKSFLYSVSLNRNIEFDLATATQQYSELNETKFIPLDKERILKVKTQWQEFLDRPFVENASKEKNKNKNKSPTT